MLSRTKKQLSLAAWRNPGVLTRYMCEGVGVMRRNWGRERAEDFKEIWDRFWCCNTAPSAQTGVEHNERQERRQNKETSLQIHFSRVYWVKRHWKTDHGRSGWPCFGGMPRTLHWECVIFYSTFLFRAWHIQNKSILKKQVQARIPLVPLRTRAGRVFNHTMSGERWEAEKMCWRDCYSKGGELRRCGWNHKTTSQVKNEQTLYRLGERMCTEMRLAWGERVPGDCSDWATVICHWHGRWQPKKRCPRCTNSTFKSAEAVRVKHFFI